MDSWSTLEGKSTAVDEELLWFTSGTMPHYPNTNDLLDCFANVPNPNLHNPLDMQWIQTHQFEDTQLNHQR